MADKPDKDSKTELATEKKILDARQKGNIPVSREAANLAYLAASIVVFGVMFQYAGTRIASDLALLLQEAGTAKIDNEADAILFLRVVGSEVFAAIGPILAAFLIAGVGASVLQNAPLPVLSRIAPDFSRISLSKGFQRLFSLMGLMEMAKTLFRFLAFVACGFMLMSIVRIEFENAVLVDPIASLLLTRKATLAVLMSLIGVSVVMLVLDLPMAYGFWRRELRMTRQEVKDEHKESEGDPHVKGRRRSMAQKMSRKRNLAAVAKATVVIANPTHFSVALKYAREEGGAPKVVAKGQDLIALEIRRIATANSIPIIEDKALARSLYAKVEVDQMIPIEFYRVVAEILIRLQARRKPSVVRA